MFGNRKYPLYIRATPDLNTIICTNESLLSGKERRGAERSLNHFTSSSHAMLGASLLDNESEPAPNAKEVGLLRVTAVLLYNLILSFLQNGLTAIVVPTELSNFAPEKAALFSGILISVGALINATSPIVGYFVDRIGRRPLLIIGAALVSGGVTLFIIGATTRSLPIYFTAYLVVQVGSVIMLTVFNAMVADLSSSMPNKAGRISGIYGFYSLVGSMFSYVAAGVLFPVTPKDHMFYYFTAVVTLISNVALLFAMPPSPPRSAETLMGEVVEAPWHARVWEVAGEWCGSEAYHPWRRVVLSRTLYYFGGGVFSGYILYFLIDRTDAVDPLSDMTILAVLALSGSFLAAWPAGRLSDSYGSVACVLVAGSVMSAVYAIIPTLIHVQILYFIVPFYGAAQMFYNVADLAMITAALPNPDKRARDMGGWAAIENIGSAIGGVISGSVITLTGSSDQIVSDIRDDDGNAGDDDSGRDRTVYTQIGYLSIFWPAALAVLVSALIVWPLSKRLRHQAKDSPGRGSTMTGDKNEHDVRSNEILAIPQDEF